ncbi:HIT family protein [Nocardia niwae]|uniref:HIT family protein n=1 Tax=Nocardia niwae TaxID=626084 RepID=UPI0007A46C0A|nr:HIT domain-containing protein [Nocardia niwae]
MDELREGCPFCERIEDDDFEQEYAATVVRFEPLNPVTPGHMLFVPTWHAEHPSAEAVRAAMGYASTYASKQGIDFNLITSSGAAATQTIPHVHVHYVPRRLDDGLALPWTGQKRAER